ncbi:hypothetical protein V1477_003458 [Vespula maculifrons]|uniref:Uncharacterized protein n=1 Tax=Vespula maculifrons TaxID=7453 RepID=A0ABD2CVG5_VESMC
MKRMQELVGDQVDNHRGVSLAKILERSRYIGSCFYFGYEKIIIRIRIVLGGLVQFVSCNLEGIIIDGKEWSCLLE